MERFSLVTGSASGIGKAVAAALRARGDRVIGADMRDADIIADLSTDEGRRSLAERAAALAPDGLDLVAPEQRVDRAPDGAVADDHRDRRVGLLQQVARALVHRPLPSARARASQRSSMVCWPPSDRK